MEESYNIEYSKEIIFHSATVMGKDDQEGMC